MKKLGKYEILTELGHGAMGTVYCARDPIINRLVALKTITTGVAGDPGLLQRFYREAQSAGGLHHPNIVTIYDMGNEGDTPYIAMELVEGENLEHVIARRATLPISLKLVYAMQACRAFDYAHKRGIVHRDIKPGNIMVNKDGAVKVVDFGIARVLDASKTQTGMLIGTFAYMSPEQYHGEHADERSDIWSFGVLLYELLCCQRPFIGETPASLMHSICEQGLDPLSKFLPDCPAELEIILSKALQKSPSDRYQSMEDLLLELEPVSKRLQAQSVAGLVDQSRRFVEQSQFTEARDLLRQALQFESSNPTVRSLLEKVNSELKRMLVRPKVQQFVEKGHSFLEEGKIQDAKIAAESALQLDSSFAPAQELQSVVRRELDRAELISGWIKSAKQHIAEGLPDDAEAMVAKVLEAEPANEQAAALQHQVIQEKADRQKRLRLLERLQYARGLWTKQNYGECIQLLVDLEREFPDDEEVPRLLETVREDQVEQRQQALLDCRNLLAARRYEECLARLANLQEQFPRDEEIPGLLEDARKDQRNQRRLQGLAEAKSVLGAGRYDECISLLTSLSREFPDELEIAGLLETAREKQEEHRRQQGVAKARELLAARRYEESTAALSALQTDFPRDAEITKLLETARRDQAEQQKQQKLAEAKAYLAVQSFEEAIALLDALAAAHPKDAGVAKLRSLVQREQDKHVRSERIQRELDALKKLMSEKKYAEVIAKAKNLLTEFPGETNFRRLAEFASSQQESVEKELLFRRTLDEAKALFDSNRFKEAVVVVQIGLRAFPANPDLLHLYQQAEIHQRKLEVRQQIEERVREIRVKINREKFSEAINLAQQTLVTLGPDTDVTQLLNSAEVEFEAREKKREQVRTLETIRTLIESGDVQAANQVIDEALKTKTLETFDPRIQRLTAQIDDAKSRKPGESTAISTSVPLSPDREYAVMPGAPPPSSPPPPEKIFPAHASTAQGAAVQPALEFQSAAPVVSSVEMSSSTASVTQPTQPPAEQPAAQSAAPTEIPTPRVETPKVPPSSVSPVKLQPVPAVSVPLWRKPAVLAVLAFGLIGAVWAGMRSLPWTPLQPPAKTSPLPQKPKSDPLELQQRDAMNAAGKLIAANDLDGARKKLQAAAALNGPLTTDIQRRVLVIDEALKDPGIRQLRRREETLWQQALKRVADGQYIEARKGLAQIVALPAGGMHRDDAQRYLDKVIPQQILANDLLAQAHLDLSQGEFQSARFKAEQLKQNGGDPTPLLAEIHQAEQSRLAQLETQFNQLKQRDDDAAIQKLKALQPKFQALSSDAGTQSNEAQGYANGIPGAIVDVQTRMQRKSAAKPLVKSATPSAAAANAAAVRAVIQRYSQAFERRDADALTKIWPTVGSKYTSYKSAFEAASAIRMHMNIRSVDVSTDGTTAIVEARVSQDYISKDASDAKTSKHAATFELDKVDDAWVITDIQETELPEN